jgi:hypothetical protein
MELTYYIKKTVLVSLIITAILTVWLMLTDFMNPALIKWIAFTFYISIISSGLIILQNFSIKLSKFSKLTIPVFGFGLVVYFILILFLPDFSNQILNLIGFSIIFLMSIQLNILGWSKTNHTFLVKLIFLISLLTNLFLASVFFFKIDMYEIKPYLLVSILISFSLLIIGVLIHNKKEIPQID